VTNFQTNLFQLFGHPRPAITVQAQAVLFSDRRSLSCDESDMRGLGVFSAKTFKAAILVNLLIEEEGVETVCNSCVIVHGIDGNYRESLARLWP